MRWKLAVNRIKNHRVGYRGVRFRSMPPRKQLPIVPKARLLIRHARYIAGRLHRLAKRAETGSDAERAQALEELKQLLAKLPSRYPPEAERIFAKVMHGRGKARSRESYRQLLQAVRALKARLKDDFVESSPVLDGSDEQARQLAEELAFTWNDELLSSLKKQKPSVWLIQRIADATGESPEAVRRNRLR